MKIPVIVLNWNGWEDTFACLRSLSEAAEASDVWLVDNGSSIDRSEECRNICPGLRVLRWSENYGWAGGYNRALKPALDEGYEFAYLLNNDCSVSHGFLQACLEPMVSNRKLAAVGSVIVFDENGGRWIKFDGKYHSLGETPLHQDLQPGVRKTSEVNGAGMLLRLAALEHAGAFDERFFCYSEESEWCRRMSRKGWQIAVAPASLVFHKCEGSNRSWNSRYYRMRNQFLLKECLEQSLTWREKWETARGILLEVYPEWRNRNRDAYLATIEGLRDGWLRHFGKRGEVRSRWPLRLVTGCFLWHWHCRSNLKLGTRIRKGLSWISAK